MSWTDSLVADSLGQLAREGKSERERGDTPAL